MLFETFDKVSPTRPAVFIVRLSLPVDPHGIKPRQRREELAQLGFNGTTLGWGEAEAWAQFGLNKICWFHLQEYYSCVKLVSVQQLQKQLDEALCVGVYLFSFILFNTDVESFVITYHLRWFWCWSRVDLISLQIFGIKVCFSQFNPSLWFCIEVFVALIINLIFCLTGEECAVFV